MELLKRRKRPKRNKNAAILGCGPAGLFAAHALREAGWQFDIYSNRLKSHMYGAQYLHAPIPGLTQSDSVKVRYILEGTEEGYRSKVYGSVPVRSTSVEDLTEEHEAWDIREAYDNAWEMYGGGNVKQMRVSHENLLDGGEGSGIFDMYPLVISSVPARAICGFRHHQFQSKQIWALGDAPDRGQVLSYAVDPNTVICNGTTDIGWYRLSNIFGHKTVEYPEGTKPPMPGIASVEKPIRHQCTCYERFERSGQLLRVGRYGRWEKGELSHQAFHRTREVL